MCNDNFLPVVSRRILKDHYQGDLEDDESPDHLQMLDNDELMNENSFESDDYAEPVSSVVTPIPPSRNYPQDDHLGFYRTTTRRPASDLQSKRGGGFFGGKFFFPHVHFKLHYTLSPRIGHGFSLSLSF